MTSNHSKGKQENGYLAKLIFKMLFSPFQLLFANCPIKVWMEDDEAHMSKTSMKSSVQYFRGAEEVSPLFAFRCSTYLQNYLMEYEATN